MSLVRCRLKRLFFRLLPLPISKNLVVFESNTRLGIVDNMKYLLLDMLNHCNDVDFPKFRFVYLTKRPQACEVLDGVEIEKLDSFKGKVLQARARIIVSDDHLLADVPVRRGQVYFNLWHGAVNYKKLGFDGLHFKSKRDEKLFSMKNPEPHFMASGSEFFIGNMAHAFRFKNTQFLKSGLPRNDLFFSKKLVEDAKRRALSCLGAKSEGKKILLYAPTFRDGAQTDTAFANFYALVPSVLCALRERFGGDWLCLYKAHYFLEENASFDGKCLNVSGWLEATELLCAADFLISDYSSIMWDSMLLKIPCVSFAPDIDAYIRADRGLTEAWESVPFAVTKTQAQLLDAIRTFDRENYGAKLEKHLLALKSYDNGSACKIISEKICEAMKK